jgi:excisionase family DNA binding protein
MSAPDIELPELPTLCTVAEAATALRSSTRTVRRLLATGRLRAAKLRLGGSSRVLVPRGELERLVRESMI